MNSLLALNVFQSLSVKTKAFEQAKGRLIVGLYEGVDNVDIRISEYLILGQQQHFSAPALPAKLWSEIERENSPAAINIAAHLSHRAFRLVGCNIENCRGI